MTSPDIDPNHVSRDVMIQPHAIPRRKRDDGIRPPISERGQKTVDILTGEPRTFREIVDEGDGKWIEFTQIRPDCSGELKVEERARMKSWMVETKLLDTLIFFATYDAQDGKLKFVSMGGSSPGAPLSMGRMGGSEMVAELNAPLPPAKEADHTRITLTRDGSDPENLSFQPSFYTKDKPNEPNPIPPANWYLDEAVHVSYEGRELAADWTDPDFVTIQVAFPDGIMKYGKIPKHLEVAKINLHAQHLDEARFPSEKMVWQVWFGDQLCQADDFTHFRF